MLASAGLPGLTAIPMINSLGRKRTGEMVKSLEHKITCISTEGKENKRPAVLSSLEKGPGKLLVGKQHQMGLHRALSRGVKPG